ncbi:hypothetical protein HMPREF1022_03317, partial [Desulfovibrio sp. 6_1_46AFAA]
AFSELGCLGQIGRPEAGKKTRYRGMYTDTVVRQNARIM